MPIYQLYNFPGFFLASLFYYHEDDTMQNISLGSDSIFYQLHIFKPNQLLKHDLKCAYLHYQLKYHQYSFRECDYTSMHVYFHTTCILKHNRDRQS